MSVSLLPLCSTGKIAVRDGYTGATARILLPFYEFGYWFASGQQYTFPSSTIVQQQGLTDQATRMTNGFVKAAGVCLNG